MNVYDVSIFDTKTGDVLEKMHFRNLNYDVNVSGGNEQNKHLPMVFIIHGDFTTYKEMEVGKTVRFKADGFDEDVKLLEMNNEMIKIETSYEVGKKLRVAGL